MSSYTTNVLVTGANGGLGLGICLRLIDDFLTQRLTTETLNIIFTTRSRRKGEETLRTLRDALHKHHIKDHGRVTFRAESDVELTNLPSIKALAQRLTGSDIAQLDVIICNAGMGGWIGLNWPKAVWTIFRDIRTNTTWPAFKLGVVGSVTKPQLTDNVSMEPEPPLAEIFCANLFGHYMLVHWLMPLLRACNAERPGKVVWVSSIEPQAYHLNHDDFQGFRSAAAYEHSKRMTDLIALTADQPATAQAVSDYHLFLNPREERGTPPSMHVFHPGIAVTSVFVLYWILSQGYLLAIYLARWAGSPWATVSPYIAAASATWLSLATEEEIKLKQERETGSSKNKVKWGTAVDRSGNATVRATEVDKWGLNGSGRPFRDQWWAGKTGLGRKPGSVDATEQDVAEFVAEGAEVWQKMEELRVDWARRIKEHEKLL